jgi:GT2 family glycosyltransferase
MNNPLLVIPTYFAKQEAYDVFEECIDSIRKTTDADVLCVDDCSPDKSLLEAAQNYTNNVDGVEWHENKINSGFSKTVNVGMKRGQEEKRDIVLVNSDIQFIEAGWLEQMANNDASIVGALLLYPNMLIQHAGIYFSIISRTFMHRFLYCMPNTPAANVPALCPVTGALQYVKYETIKEIGIYDENFFMGYEDVDYNLRALFAEGTCLYDPKVKAIHHESLIRKGVNNHKQVESLKYMLKKYENIHFSGYVPTMLEREVINE